MNDQIECSKLQTLNTLEVSKDLKKVILPSLIDGRIEIVGSSDLSIVELDGTVHIPLVDTNVSLSLKGIGQDNTCFTKEVNVLIPGKYRDVKNENEELDVIPCVKQFVRKKGYFTIESGMRISNDPIFDEQAEQFINDAQSYGMFLSKGIGEEEINVELVSNQGLLKEGYRIHIQEDKILIEVEHFIGCFYAFQTLLQLLDKPIPCGIILDYPSYETRGFMIDSGRKFIEKETIKDMIRHLAFYKMNELQIHLNDNFIFLEDYGPNPKDAAYGSEEDIEWLNHIASIAESGFRIETSFSNTVNGEKRYLTSKDHYTVDEFKEFVKMGKRMGVNIVPEIDSPAHALSITRVYPELMYCKDPGKEYLTDHKSNRRAEELDLSKEETIHFMQSLFDELMEGPFRDCDTIHIGTDEYMGDSNEYRIYVNRMIEYIESKCKTPRIWGSFTKKKGLPIINGKNKRQMGLWCLDWNTPQHAIEHDFAILNMLDDPNYTVPDGNGSRNEIYKRDYLDLEASFAFKPNRFKDQVYGESDPHIIGASWAMWNDYGIDLRDCGLTSIDEFRMFYDGLMVMALNTWDRNVYQKGFKHFMKRCGKKKFAPNTNSYRKLDTECFRIGRRLCELDVYRKTYEESLGINGECKLSLIFNQLGVEQTILRNNEHHRIFVTSENELAYEYDGRVYVFDYKIHLGKEMHINMKNQWQKVLVEVDGEMIEFKKDERHPNRKYHTFVIPMMEIGGFNGVLVKGEFKQN